MNESAARSSPSFTSASEQEFESPAAVQLRHGFPWLKFRALLEQEFQQENRNAIRGQVRVNLWLAIICVCTFFIAGYWALARELNAELNLVRFCIIVPALLVALGLTYSDLYHRAFSPLAQIVAPLFGLSVVGEALLAAQYEMSVFSAVVLTVVGIYLLVGMSFYAAVRSSLLVLVAYVLGSQYMQTPPAQAIYEMVVLLVSNIVGATACYALEKAQRTNYLEAKLLMEMASRDGLTSIYNRRMFDEHLDKVWQQAGREHASIALLLVDIDYFKAYNDYYGHQAGDQCLKHVARSLAHCARRPLDFTARYGGEEFAVVLYDVRREYVEDLTRRIQASMASLALKHPASLVAGQLTVSIGAACVVPDSSRSRFGFIQLADEALYEAKGSGRNRAVIMDKEYEEMSTGSFRSRGVVSAIPN
ncbi:MAG: diguanylate cyclase [Candidatus Obscuribacterales bacterium]|nr:diguanylate cyclase [Steroidobacteraceae bacterium]